MSEKLDRLDPLLAQLKKLDAYEEQGAPVSHRFLMYSGDAVREPLSATYLTLMGDGFVRTVKHVLEQRLLKATGDRYYQERESLKLYLMLQDTEHRDVAWATDRLAHIWVEALVSVSDLSRTKLRRRLLPHVAYHLSHAPSIPVDDNIVERTRTMLSDVPVKQRYESLFVTSIELAVYDPLLDPVRSNLQFPPLS